MLNLIKSAMQVVGRTEKFFLKSIHFPTLVVTVAVVGIALLFANITPASLPKPTILNNFEQEAEGYLLRLEQGEELQTTSQAWPAEYTTIVGELRSGDTLGDAMRRSGIEEQLRTRIIWALDGLLDFRSLRPRDRFSLILDDNGQLAEYRYESGPLDIYRVWPDEEQKLQAERLSVTLERRTKQIAGQVTSSLFAAFQPHGESPRLIHSFADIFASHIDFNVEVRPGDRFTLVFEKYFNDNEFAGYGRLLSASYQRADGELFEAFRYQSDNTPASFFDREGNELGTSFLRSPVPMARVTSGFTYRRKHPILDVVRPHLAVDLAAPEGTPVMTTADGRVVFRAMNGDNGNMVIIDHGNGYRSAYAHLSGFRRGLKVGDRVRQKDIIGYVGSTGLATGPHVCYRIQKNGRYVDPMGLKFKPRSVLNGAELAALHEQIEQIEQLTGWAQNSGEQKQLLKVHNITLQPEERLSQL